MDDPKNEANVQQQTVLAWALAELGLRVPSDAADQVAVAIERASEIDRRVRAELGGLRFDTARDARPCRRSRPRNSTR